MPGLLRIVTAVATYLAGALLGKRALARLGFATAKGSANKVATAPLILAAALNLVIAIAVGAEDLALGGARAGLRLAVHPADVGWALAGGALLLAVAASFARGRDTRRAVPPAKTRLAAALLLALFCGAFMEELVFRAVLLGGLMPLGPFAALAIAAAVFVAIHLPTGGITGEALIGWSIGGVALGGVWLAGAPLITATSFHLAHNLGNVLWLRPVPGVGRATAPTPSPASRLLRYLFDAAVMIAIATLAYR